MLCALLLAVAAGRIEVSPDPVRLRADAPRATLTLHNASGRALHVIATTWSWWQSASGETRLDPSAEISVTPAEVYLAAGARKTVEVSVEDAPSEVERAFRIELEQEPLQAFGRAPPQAQHVSVAVFVAPEKAASSGAIADLGVAAGRARFTLVNSGNAHLRAAQLRVSLLGRKAERLALQKLPEWVVLARAQVSYDVPLSRRACVLARSVEVEVRAGDGASVFRKAAPVTPEDCR